MILSSYMPCVNLFSARIPETWIIANIYSEYFHFHVSLFHTGPDMSLCLTKHNYMKAYKGVEV